MENNTHQEEGGWAIAGKREREPLVLFFNYLRAGFGHQEWPLSGCLWHLNWNLKPRQSPQLTNVIKTHVERSKRSLEKQTGTCWGCKDGDITTTMQRRKGIMERNYRNADAFSAGGHGQRVLKCSWWGLEMIWYRNGMEARNFLVLFTLSWSISLGSFIINWSHLSYDIVK